VSKIRCSVFGAISAIDLRINKFSVTHACLFELVEHGDPALNFGSRMCHTNRSFGSFGKGHTINNLESVEVSLLEKVDRAVLVVAL